MSHPDVFKSPNSDTYVVFGEVRWDQSLLSLLASAVASPDRSLVLQLPPPLPNADVSRPRLTTRLLLVSEAVLPPCLAWTTVTSLLWTRMRSLDWRKVRVLRALPLGKKGVVNGH